MVSGYILLGDFPKGQAHGLHELVEGDFLAQLEHSYVVAVCTAIIAGMPVHRVYIHVNGKSVVVCRREVVVAQTHAEDPRRKPGRKKGDLKFSPRVPVGRLYFSPVFKNGS